MGAQGPALEGCSEEVGLADGGQCEGGVPRVRRGRVGWVAGVLRVHIDVWLALVGLGWAGGCQVASWVRGGLWGALVVSWRPADGDEGRVRGAEGVGGLWVMHGMVMDETLHVFPGGGVGELFCVLKQEVFAVYHLGRCSADCF